MTTQGSFLSAPIGSTLAPVPSRRTWPSAVVAKLPGMRRKELDKCLKGRDSGCLSTALRGTSGAKKVRAVGRTAEGHMTLSLPQTATSCPMRWPWRKRIRECRGHNTSAENCGRGDQRCRGGTRGRARLTPLAEG